MWFLDKHVHLAAIDLFGFVINNNYISLILSDLLSNCVTQTLCLLQWQTSKKKFPPEF